MFATILDGCYFQKHAIQSSLYWSGIQGTETLKSSWKGEKPVPRPYNGFRDHRNYGSPIARLFQDDADTRFLREKGVTHLSSRGLVYPRHDSLYSIEGQSPEGFLPWNKRGTLPNGASYRLSGSDFFAGLPQTLSPTELDYWLGDDLEYISDVFQHFDRYDAPIQYAGVVSPWPSQTFRCVGNRNPINGWYFGDVCFSASATHIDLGNLVWYPGYAGQYTRAVIRWYLSDNQVSTGGETYGKRLFRAVTTMSVITYLLFPEFGAHGPDDLLNWRVHESHPNSWTIESEPECIPLSNVYESKIASAVSIKQFKSLVHAQHSGLIEMAPDIRPSCMVSYADAIATAKATTTNYVEVIKEGKELFELLPGLVSIVKTFLKLRSGSLSEFAENLPGDIRTIGDLLADWTLLQRFGLTPAASNAGDIRATLARVGSSLRALQADQTMHGVSFFDLEGTHLGPGSLVTRSTIRMGGVKDDFVLKLLALDTLGLAPTASNLWDTVPWSWFLDYFTGLADKFNVIDAVIYGLIREVHYITHSYTIYSDHTENLKDLGLASHDLEVKHYFRETSRTVPTLFGGKIDYLAGKGANRAITSAILWNMLSQ